MADPSAILYLVRHGQAMWQVERGAELDSSLSALGHVQSAALARHLGEMFSRAGTDAAEPMLFTSPLRRARETCRYLENALAVEAVVLPNLAEAAFRVADHLPVAPVPFGAEASSAASADYETFRARAADTLRSLFASACETGRTIVVVGHGGQIKTMLRVAAASDSICFEILNTGVTILEWREGRWIIAGLSCCDHLERGQRSR